MGEPKPVSANEPSFAGFLAARIALHYASMSPRLEFALNVAYDAGRSTLALFNTAHSVDYKSDRSPVTDADREAESLIRSALQNRFPEDGILGEEEGESGSSGSRWVVDPIDGTKSFICGVPLYATLLSYELEGLPQLAVSYFPALDRMIYAEKGQGAFCNGRRCHVSGRRDLAGAVLCCGSHGSMEQQGRSDGFLTLAKQSLVTRTWGDAFGHSLVALGRAEAMVDPVLKRWDISAMQLIVEEAGGRMSAFDGSANPQDQAVSTNGFLHDRILAAFAL